MKILIADDCDADMLRVIFEGAGWDVFTAVDGRDALRVYHNAIEHDSYFDVLLLDVLMPRLNGFAVGLNIRNLEVCGRIPRAWHFYLTGAGDILPQQQLLDSRWMGELFVDGYIHKPIDGDELLARVDKMIKEAINDHQKG